MSSLTLGGGVCLKAGHDGARESQTAPSVQAPDSVYPRSPSDVVSEIIVNTPATPADESIFGCRVNSKRK
jgi:hypothetical protein